jgi:hypothetical protein
MTTLAPILALFLCLYAALAGLTWAQRLIGERLPARKRGMALNLARRAGPPIAGGLVVLVAGAVLALPGHIPLAAMLIGGGLSFGLHRGLSDVRQGDPRSIAFRAALTLGLGLALLWQTGLI